jgi:hypothetical protein
MRKLLALILILGMASMANAALELSVNGQPAPPEITLQPSDWIELDIHCPTGELGGADLAIILSNPQGHLVWDGMTFIELIGLGRGGVVYYEGPWDGPWQTQASSTPHEVYFNGGNASLNAQAPFVLMQGLMFHCDEPTDVIIDLVAISDVVYYDAAGNPIPEYEQGTIIDSIYVIQPEPMTLSLLGLGGLALLRRRR